MTDVETELLAIALYESEARASESAVGSPGYIRNWRSLTRHDREVWRIRAQIIMEEYEND